MQAIETSEAASGVVRGAGKSGSVEVNARVVISLGDDLLLFGIYRMDTFEGRRHKRLVWVDVLAASLQTTYQRSDTARTLYQRLQVRIPAKPNADSEESRTCFRISTNTGTTSSARPDGDAGFDNLLPNH